MAARTVRMLAPRFMPAKEWVLRFKQEQGKKTSAKSWRSPDQQREELSSSWPAASCGGERAMERRVVR